MPQLRCICQPGTSSRSAVRSCRLGVPLHESACQPRGRKTDSVETEHADAGPEATARLSALGDELIRRLGPETVQRDDDGLGVSVEPGPDACPVSWKLWGQTLILGIGRGGCRWELELGSDDVTFIEGVVEAAVAGRVSEVFGLARSEVTVTLTDGTQERTSQATAPLGLPPILRWRRKDAQRVAYAPFA